MSSGELMSSIGLVFPFFAVTGIADTEPRRLRLINHRKSTMTSFSKGSSTGKTSMSASIKFLVDKMDSTDN